jgi:putative ABC transport system permease protein
MDPLESVRIALRAVRGHKLRSALTVVGIVVGIAAVVTFVTFGASLKADVVGEIEASGANELYVYATPSGDQGFPDAPQPVVTGTDVTELAATEGVTRVVPQGRIRTTTLTHAGDEIAQRQVTATTAAAFEGASFAAGGPFETGQRQAVVNEQAAGAFAQNLSVGDEVTIARPDGSAVTVTVVGVLDESLSLTPFGSFAPQPRVYVPTDPMYDTTVESPQTGTQQRVYPIVTVSTTAGEAQSARDRVETYLAGPDSDAGQLVSGAYELRAQTNGDLADRIERIVDRLTRFVSGIAFVSLFVGAVGIANIMLVSVTERTREIGIMKAVGARNRDVMQLFVIEAAILGGVGAVIGTPVGVLGGWAATEYADLPLTLAPDWFAVAVLVGVGVGVLAGLYPAWRAARVDPVEALRRE